ncbi:MAG: phytoene dehydrogenase-like protein [Marinomonas primoryensis]|jgi:phytoene dehydrogenase-like protein
MSEQFDAVVIGAGTGGMCAAARLAHTGYRTLVVESLDRIGGRASTRNVGEFSLNTGALAIEKGGMVDQTLAEVGIKLDLVFPAKATVLLWGRHEIDVSKGIMKVLRNVGPGLVLGTMHYLLPWLRPKPKQTVEQWLNRISKNHALHALINNVNCGMFAATNDILLAEVFVHYMWKGSGFKHLGYPVGGTINVWKPIVPLIEKNGGAVWLSSTVKRLLFDDRGLVRGVLIDHNGETKEVGTRIAVSNTGPLATVELSRGNIAEVYAQHVESSTKPAGIITVHFASQKPLTNVPELAFIAKSRRLAYFMNFSDPAHKRCPVGWYLYSAASVPRPACGEFDIEEEKELLFGDIREYFSGFDESMVLAVDVTAHQWPAQRAVSGFDLPVETPIDNLWNVGDGVKPWAEAGTAACARSAQKVVMQILKKYPLPIDPA